MFPHKLIYKSGAKVHGEVFLTPVLFVRILYHSLRLFGAGLVAFAVTGAIFSLYPIAKDEYLYRFGSVKDAEYSKFAAIIDKSQAEELGLDSYFSVFIPKIDAKAKVIPNVDAGSSSAYLKALSQGVAHAAGTGFPGNGKLIYLFSHSTDSPINIARYNATFYLLRKLTPGDRVVVYFLGREYSYTVTDRFITKADDTSWLKDGSLGERLILQTCDPPGTSWNRLIVVAKPT